MNTLPFARQRIAQSVLVIGTGFLLLYLPAILSVLGIGRWPLLLWIPMLPLGVYVIGRGIAGVIEGIIRMVHAIRDLKEQ